MAHPYRLDAAAEQAAKKAAEIASMVLARHATEVDSTGRFPHESLTALAGAGLLGLTLPASHGGKGIGMRGFAAVTEELAGACGSTAMIYVMHVSAAAAIASAEHLSTRDGVLRDIASGGHLTTLAFSERGSRSLFWAPVSKLETHNGSYRLDAEKSWVTSAGHANSYVTSAQQPHAGSALESTVFLVRRTAEGVKVSGSFDGLGLRGNESSPVTLTDVRVEQEDLISPLGEGATTMLQVVLPWFSIGTAAMSNGLCRAAVAATTAHLSGTTFTHTGTQLRDLPNLRARLAQMAVHTEQARALLGHALDQIESGAPEAPLLVLQTRLASLRAADEVTDLAMKACGGAAFSKHLGLDRVFRDARAGWVMAPTVDHLLDFSGRALTGLPLFG